jgi:hypothetical protein
VASHAPSASAPLGPPAGFAPSRPYDPDEPPPYLMPPAPPAPRRPRRPRAPSLLAPIAVSIGVVVAGVLLALGASHAVDVTAESVFAAALLTVGLALVVGTWIGRGRGLIALGTVLTVGLVTAATLNVPLRGGIGNRFETPTSLADLHSSYHLAIGAENLDFSAVPIAGTTQHISATVGTGRLYVTVPSNTKVVVHARAGAGHLLIGYPQANGTAVEANGTHVSRDVTIPASGPQTGEFDLDLRVGIGEIHVDRVPATTATATGAQP